MEDRIEAVLSLAEEIALEAGEIIRRLSGKADTVEAKESRSDLVTEVDKRCEELIRTRVQNAFPLHKMVGEETATAGELAALDARAGEDDWTWIVDPIDGTLNFISGMPLSVVSIGVARAGAMEVGVVYNPFHGELFCASRGKGAYLNGKPIAPLPRDTELEDTPVSVGYPSKPEVRLAMLRAVAAVAPNVRTVRALGSAALHISYVAAGRLGAFFEYGLKSWDVAAARLILEEAGGEITDMEGGPLPLSGGSVLATNGGELTHRRLLGLIAGARE